MNINYVAVLVAAIANMALGFLWYSPFMLGKPWMKLMGYHMHDKEQMEKMKKEAMPAYAGSMIASLVMAYVLVNFIHFAVAKTALEGATIGFWAWFGFVGTTSLTGALFNKKSISLWAIDSGYFLVALLIMGAILAAWV